MTGKCYCVLTESFGQYDTSFRDVSCFKTKAGAQKHARQEKASADSDQKVYTKIKRTSCSARPGNFYGVRRRSRSKR